MRLRVEVIESLDLVVTFSKHVDGTRKAHAEYVAPDGVKFQCYGKSWNMNPFHARVEALQALMCQLEEIAIRDEERLKRKP